MSEHSFRVNVTSIDDTPGCLSSLVNIQLQRGTGDVTFRFLLNCGAFVRNQRLISRTVELLTTKEYVNVIVYTLLLLIRSKLQNLDGILLTGPSLYECGGLPIFNMLVKNSSSDEPPVIGQHTNHSTKHSLPPVYCTDPTFKFGKLGLYDDISHLEKIDNCRIEFDGDDESRSLKFRRLSDVCQGESLRIPTFDDIDASFDKCVRLRYKESVFFRKQERRKDPMEDGVKDNSLHRIRSQDFADGQDVTLTLRAFPSGRCIGGAVWFISTDGFRTSLLLGDKFTTRPNW